MTPTPSAAYNLVIVGGSAAAVSVAISSQRSGLGLVRIVESGTEVAFPHLVGDEQLDVGYGETVTSIDIDRTVDAHPAGGDSTPDPTPRLVVVTTKQTYTTRAVMIATRTPVAGWVPPFPSPEASERIHVNELPEKIDDLDILVVGTNDRSVELAEHLAAAGGRVVLAGRGIDPTKLSPAAEAMLHRLERERRATVLYRSRPDAIAEIGGHPMAYFNDRRIPDLQFDDVVFAPPTRPVSPDEVGISPEALATPCIWFEGDPNDPNDPSADTSTSASDLQLSPGWHIGLDIGMNAFPELDLAEPTPPADRRRRHTAAIPELRDEYYNATITRFEPTHSDLWVLRIRPDQGDASHLPGQYASLGLGYWEDRIDDAEDPNLDERWERLIRRSYSISSRIFDDHGYLADDTTGNELEFYIVLVPPTPDNVPALTPRLALKRPGDRIYLGPKVAGHYTLDSITDPEATVVFLSTGTGEAPHNAMVVELLRKGHVGPVVSAVSVRQWADLGYEHKHRLLEKRYANYHYLPMPTREPDVPKRYIQDLLTSDELGAQFGITLDAERTHVFLCGNPAMIGLPTDEADDGTLTFPETVGVVQLLTERGFTLDRRRRPGNIHYEEYW